MRVLIVAGRAARPSTKTFGGKNVAAAASWAGLPRRFLSAVMNERTEGAKTAGQQTPPRRAVLSARCHCMYTVHYILCKLTDNIILYCRHTVNRAWDRYINYSLSSTSNTRLYTIVYFTIKVYRQRLNTALPTTLTQQFNRSLYKFKLCERRHLG